MPKFLVTFSDGTDPLLVETSGHYDDRVEVGCVVDMHFRKEVPVIDKIIPTFTDEVPPMPEGSDWWKIVPERNGFHSLWKYVPVSEWWSPSFAGNYVAVQAMYLKSRDAVLLTVSGGDDDVCTLGYLPVDEALAAFNRIGPGITKEELRQMGFEW